ncbi:MAG: citrate lyase acyl carrier protein [Sphaerochaetaceae bacterium]|jgi:citrate lyase subunit gamma (acyl carrier protein)|nr:citrate lyase acyl carrier protein [Sphaerochaetaceae bacterium]
MKIIRRSVSGTLESSDIMFQLESSQDGKNHIELDSSVEKQFGDSIRSTINQTLSNFNITNADVSAVDKGALECIIVARLKAAIYHSVSEEDRENKAFKS